MTVRLHHKMIFSTVLDSRETVKPNSLDQVTGDGFFLSHDKRNGQPT